MRVPNLVYNFASLKDIAGGLILLVVRDGGDTQAAVSVAVELIEVPRDKIFILSVFSGLSTPGATQTVLTQNLFLRPEGEAGSAEIVYKQNSDQELNFSGEVWCPPGSKILFASSFDAGANTNRNFGTIHGFMIPRGNIQQG